MTEKRVLSRCFGHPDCPMTAGYYLGAGQWICWLHALFNSVWWKAIKKETGQKLQALPKEGKGEYQNEISY